ncbi:MAG TPA: 30S ribosomal protein S16 [Nitrospira sp.]|jgi:small subunit ribosomal protein S16|nr:30S ribosomal protein S16 [Nitrospira sp.]HZO51813.1 30S ribosomal protein S16 [Bryobacteraceae bacterium]
MLKIRLARVGAKKKPSYRVVVMEDWRARDSRCVEIVGQYNPVVTPAEVKLNRDRIEHWIAQGAQPTDVVKRLLKSNPVQATA